jgi:hypothetical protein
LRLRYSQKSICADAGLELPFQESLPDRGNVATDSSPLFEKILGSNASSGNECLRFITMMEKMDRSYGTKMNGVVVV